MAAKTKYVNPIPTGCPGPIKGTKLWACNGEDCPYGPYQYGCCKQAIADRGYTLMLDKEQEEQMRQDAELIKVSLQAQLQDVNNILQHKESELDQTKVQVMLTRSETDYIAELYAAQMIRAYNNDEQRAIAEQGLADAYKEKVQLQHEFVAQQDANLGLTRAYLQAADELVWRRQIMQLGEVNEAQHKTGDEGSSDSSCGSSTDSDGRTVTDSDTKVTD